MASFPRPCYQGRCSRALSPDCPGGGIVIFPWAYPQIIPHPKSETAGLISFHAKAGGTDQRVSFSAPSVARTAAAPNHTFARVIGGPPVQLLASMGGRLLVLPGQRLWGQRLVRRWGQGRVLAEGQGYTPLPRVRPPTLHRLRAAESPGHPDGRATEHMASLRARCWSKTAGTPATWRL